MAPQNQERQILLAKDATFEQILHKGSANTATGFAAMMKKDKVAQQAAVDQYFQHWDGKDAKKETAEEREARVSDYASLTRQYYNLATDFYEYGWSTSFHFCRFGPREPFQSALARHEHYLAHTLSIPPSAHVLDMGCGVGGPAREIARFTGAHITGVTINAYQVERARRYAERDGLSGRVDFVQGDFMKLPFGEGTFDRVYAIEATVHAPSLEECYKEAWRVLKPGGLFGVYEWVMTPRFDETNPRHLEIRRGIEVGCGISQMCGQAEARAAMEAAGFEVLRAEDLADGAVVDGQYETVGADGRGKGDGPVMVERESPWYWPLDKGGMKYAAGIGEMLTVARMTPWGRWIAHGAMGIMEMVGLAPPGTVRTGEAMVKSAETLVAGGREGLFTPMYLMVGRKREVSE